MERDAGRLRQRETSKIIRAHYRQALASPAVDAFLSLESFNFGALNIKSNLLSSQ